MTWDRKTYRLNPYLSLGLRCNPFVLEEGWEVARSLWIDRGYSAPPLPKANQLVQIIGVKGAGKTSHLRRWQGETGGPYCYYPPGLQRFKRPAVDRIAYWDEADRIPWIFLLGGLAIAKRRCSTIVAGTHEDLSLAARMVGLPVKTVRIPPFDARQLVEWATMRIKAARVSNVDCRLLLDEATAREIAIASAGSWREAADLLHIWAAERAQLSAAATQ